MKSLAHPLIIAGALLAAFAANAAEPAAGDPKFEKLFSKPGIVGEEWVIRHWEDISEPPRFPVSWDVDTDGVLHGTARYATGNTGEKWIGTWLLSRKQYGDFILETDFKFANGGKSGNGGIAIRTPLAGDPAYAGLEVQITDERFERSYFPNATNEQLSGALYLVSPAKELAYLPEQWNHYRIEARGSKIKVWLNKKLVQDVDLKTLTKPAKKHGKGEELLPAPSGSERPLRGHIGFQDLSENGDHLTFRNTQIAELN